MHYYRHVDPQMNMGNGVPTANGGVDYGSALGEIPAAMLQGFYQNNIGSVDSGILKSVGTFVGSPEGRVAITQFGQREDILQDIQAGNIDALVQKGLQINSDIERERYLSSLPPGQQAAARARLNPQPAASGMGTGTMIALGVGAVVLIGGGIYMYTQSGKKSGVEDIR